VNVANSGGHARVLKMIRVRRRPSAQPSTAQQWQRLTNIESLRSWATSLLTIARHGTMKDTLRHVIGDLEDALGLLRQKKAQEGPAVWTRVDRLTAHARSRIRRVADFVRTIGIGRGIQESGRADARRRRRSPAHT
jgi:hypothetical protein